MIKDMCPGCGRHCYLDAVGCPRGEDYAKTGIMPPRVKRSEGHAGGKRPSEKKMQYLALDCEGKLIWNIREMAGMIPEHWEDGKLFDCLWDEDREALRMLLEKVKHDWNHRSDAAKGEHHEKM